MLPHRPSRRRQDRPINRMRFIRTYTQSQLLRYAGLFTWACAGISLPFMPRLQAAGAQSQLAGTLAAYFGFAISFWWLTREIDGSGRRGLYLLLLVAMTVSALASDRGRAVTSPCSNW